MAAVARIASQPRDGTDLRTCSGAAESSPGVAEAIQARLEVSCAYRADDLDASVLERGRRRVRRFRQLHGRWRQRPDRAGAGGRTRRRRAVVEPGVARGVAGWRGQGGRRRGGGGRRRGRDRGPGVGAGLDLVRPAAAAREGRGAVRTGREAVRRAALAGAAEPGAVGRRAVLVLHPARARRRTACRSSGAFAGSPGALEALEVAAGPGRWIDGAGAAAAGPRPRPRHASCSRPGPTTRGCAAPTRRDRRPCRSTARR